MTNSNSTDSITDLRMLLVSDPEDAVTRALTQAHLYDPVEVSGLLIDGGATTGNEAAVRHALTLLKVAQRSEPGSATISYFVGNGYRVLAEMNVPKRNPVNGTRNMAFYEATRAHRQKARVAFASAAAKDLGTIGQQSWINLGNDLTASGRVVEGYDCFTRALPNPIAAGWAAEALINSARTHPAEAPTLLAQARRLAALAQSDLDYVARCVTPSTAAYFAKMPADPTPASGPDQTTWSDYERFVAAHRLHLSTVIEGVSPTEWDHLRLPALNEPIDTDANTPILVAMTNTCIADYLAARRTAFHAWEPDFSDAALYLDSLDYAMYGQRVSQLGLALRAALDLLDRVAVAANHYFGIGLKAKHTDFAKVWRNNERPRDLRPEVQAEVDAENYGILALVELSDDLLGAGSGWLADRRTLRNVATHRFLVVHDITIGDHRQCDEVTHVHEHHLQNSVLSALQIARAALNYFVGAVARREHRLHHGDVKVRLPMMLRSHDAVRRPPSKLG